MAETKQRPDVREAERHARAAVDAAARAIQLTPEVYHLAGMIPDSSAYRGPTREFADALSHVRANGWAERETDQTWEVIAFAEIACEEEWLAGLTEGREQRDHFNAALRAADAAGDMLDRLAKEQPTD